ncbi:MAG: ABC transporter substrate-binding protein [Eubacterium sp.]|nr:ABC transporter substrate-binding protein [Eubacterium sp.]
MRKRYIALFLAIAVVISCFAGCSANNSDTDVTTTISTTAKEKDNSTFKLSYTQSDSLDPFKAKTQNNQVLASLVFESLFDLDESYEPVTNIATGYAFTNDKTLRVDINPQLKFSDGSDLDIEDVVFSINAAKKSPAYGSALTCINSVEANGNSVIINLKYANPFAVNLLTFPITSVKDDENGFPVGNGRYYYANQDGTVVLKANTENGFDPYLTTITLVNIAAADSIDNAVNIGNISYAFRDMSADTSKRLSCAKKPVAMNNLVFIGINSISGVTADAQIRRAISLAVDRTVLAESAYAGYASVATSTFHPDFKTVGDINLFSDTADSSTARQALIQSGYTDKELSLSILVDTNENKLSCANLLKSQLENAGFRVTIEKKSIKEYRRRVSNIEFDLYIGEIKLSDDMSLYPFFDSKGGARYGINDKEMTCDDIYKKYLSGDEELGKFILAFNDEMPYIPILYKKGMICYSKALKGDMQGYYGNFFSNIDSWNFIS